MNTNHDNTVCKRVPFTEQYSNKNHSASFSCPVCGQVKRQNLNFLGGRYQLVCNGVKFSRELKPRYLNLQTEHEFATA